MVQSHSQLALTSPAGCGAHVKVDIKQGDPPPAPLEGRRKPPHPYRAAPGTFPNAQLIMGPGLFIQTAAVSIYLSCISAVLCYLCDGKPPCELFFNEGTAGQQKQDFKQWPSHASVWTGRSHYVAIISSRVIWEEVREIIGRGVGSGIVDIAQSVPQSHNLGRAYSVRG